MEYCAYPFGAVNYFRRSEVVKKDGKRDYPPMWIPLLKKKDCSATSKRRKTILLYNGTAHVRAPFYGPQWAQDKSMYHIQAPTF